MRAIVVDEDGQLHWQEVNDPTCAAHQVLVDVHASAVNRADLLQRAGHYPPPPGAPPYMGLEMCGTIRSVGDQVRGWYSGDRVLALLSGGGYAEQVAVHADHLIALPKDWSFTRGAAVPEVFLTAFVNLFIEAQLQPGETVLIHGGGSGVGTAAIQLAKSANCNVIATAGTDAKTARCMTLGADIAINYHERDFAEATLAHCKGVDVILDISAADYLERNIRILNPMGRLVFIALLSGTHAPLDMAQVLRKRLRLIGSTLRSRTDTEKTAITHAFTERFWPLITEGSIVPVIDTVWPIERAEEAQQLLTQNKNIGKVVLAIRKTGESL